jgi:hypothetical protein
MPYPELPPVTLDTFGEPELIDLDDRIAHILRMRSGMMGEPTTQREIGEELGIGRARISQLEHEGLTLIRKLREVQRHCLQIPPPRRGDGAMGYIWSRLRNLPG